jgi:phage terminase small subunit
MAKINTIKLSNTEEVTLSDKQVIFCEAYLADPNRNQRHAAIEAGYSARSATTQGSRMITNDNVQRYIEFKTKPLLDRYGATHANIIQELVKVGMSDVRNYLNADMSFKKLDEINPNHTGAIQSIKITKSKPTEGFGKEEEILEFKLWDKLKALTSLAEMAGLKMNEEAADSKPSNVQNNFYGPINNHIKDQ